MALTLGGCFSGEKALPPHEALTQAAQRIDTILQDEAAQDRGSVSLDPPKTPHDPNTVSFWYYTHPLAGPAMASPERWADFSAKHPGVTLETQFIGEWNYAVEKLAVSLATDDLPDMAMVKRGWLAQLITSGRIAPLDTVLPPSLLDDIRAPSRKAFVVDGRLYALPADGFCSVLYYNTTIIKEAPKDWEALRRLACQIKEEDGANGTYPLGDVPFIEMLWSASGVICNDKKSGLASPEAFEALDFILALRDKGLIHPRAIGAPESAFQLFLAGKVAMTVASSQHVVRARKASFPVGRAPLPGKNGPASMLSDNAIVVFAQYADAKRLALGSVADFLTGSEVQGAEAAALGSVPTRTSVARNVALVKELCQAYDHARNTPLVAPWSQVEFELMRSLHLAFQYTP